MMVDGSRAWELTYRAVRELAAGSAPLGERLRSAWIYHLVLLELPGVPWPDLAERYRNIADFFQSDPKTGLLIIEGLGEDDQRRRAEEIVDLYNGVCQRYFAALRPD